MSDTVNYLKRISQKFGFNREFFNDLKVPTSSEEIIILPFFGEFKSTFALSALLLKRIKENTSRYFILASWEGYKGLFPYVDEYWSFSTDRFESLYDDAKGFQNEEKSGTLIYRNLNKSFDNIYDIDNLNKYYDNGLTDAFWKDFKSVEVSLPNVPSTTILGAKFNAEMQKRAGFKIFIYPSKWIYKWFNGKSIKIKISKDVWVNLVEYLLKNDYCPVVQISNMTHDLSPELSEKCIFFRDNDISKTLAAMRITGCVLDFFSESSKLALLARCPFVSVSERSKYFDSKDYELDDLCGNLLPKNYIFSFPSIIDNKESLFILFQTIDNKIKKFISTIDYGNLPSTAEKTQEVSYEDLVRKKEFKRMGINFIKFNKDNY